MPLPRTRWVRLATALAAAGLVLTACSEPEPGSVPTASATSAAPTSTGSGSTTPAAAPTSGAPTSAAPTTSSEPDQSVEPSLPVETAPAKRIDEPATTGGAQVSLVSVRATSIKSDVGSSGPGVLVRLSVRNTAKRTLDTSFVQVSVTGDAGQPGVLVSGDPTRFLSGSLRAGARAEGTYAFVLDGATSAPLTVAVFVNQGQPVVQFRGRAS